MFVWLLFIALLIKIARHFCLAHRLIRSLYCSVFKESSLFKRLDYLTTIRYFLSSTFFKFLKEDFIVAAALAATGMMIPWMEVCVNWFLKYFLTRLRHEGSEGSRGFRRFRGGGIALAGDEYFAACGGSAAFGSENHTTGFRPWKCTLIPLRGLSLKGSMSLDFRVALLPYEPRSLATPIQGAE
ncbi:hypothetical protein [uncultured Dialister sp.]|uniref:hypothetical protein n=1 Tax=uncultured Dialister sp. TaxID=278064 RepID=UPI0025E0D854|nr:hypothetical protein [uncultured Dialister sp.]